MPLSASVSSATLSISAVVHGTIDPMADDRPCAQPVMCHDDEWCLEKRSVVFIINSDGTGSGTGVLVNNHVSVSNPRFGEENAAYILTAFHNLFADPTGTKKDCSDYPSGWLPQQSSLDKMEIIIGAYGSTTPNPLCHVFDKASVYQTRLRGVVRKQSLESKDIALIYPYTTVGGNKVPVILEPEVAAYFAGWKAVTGTLTTPLTLISHPLTTYMQIAQSADNIEPGSEFTCYNTASPHTHSKTSFDQNSGACPSGSAYVVTFDNQSFRKNTDSPPDHYGYFEAGSSGGPLFDGNHYVVGIASRKVNCYCPLVGDGCPCSLSNGSIGYNYAYFIRLVDVSGNGSILRILAPEGETWLPGRFIDVALRNRTVNTSTGKLIRRVPSRITVSGNAPHVSPVQPFTAQSGSITYLSSETRIDLQPGTYINSGATFTARITPVHCDSLVFNLDQEDLDQNADWNSKVVRSELIIEMREPSTSAMTYRSQIRPNPVSTQATFDFVALSGSVVHVQVFDATGRLIETIPTGHNGSIGGYSLEVDVSNLHSGTYYYRYYDGEYSETRRFVVAR
jgi:hypothetical protein